MISAQIFWQSKRLVGFDIKGHADYAPHGGYSLRGGICFGDYCGKFSVRAGRSGND